MAHYHDPESGITVKADNAKAAATAIQTKLEEGEKKVNVPPVSPRTIVKKKINSQVTGKDD